MSDEPKQPEHTAYDDEIIEEEREERRSNIPVVTMAVSLVVLAVTIGVIAYVVSRATNDVPVSQQTPSVQPTGQPQLPQEVGEYSRAPGRGGDAEPEGEALTSTAIYVRNGQESMIIVATRPGKPPREQLQDIGATNIVDYDDAATCGRDSDDQDVCAVAFGNTLIVVQGLRDQSTDDMVQFAREVAPRVG